MDTLQCIKKLYGYYYTYENHITGKTYVEVGLTESNDDRYELAQLEERTNNYVFLFDSELLQNSLGKKRFIKIKYEYQYERLFKEENEKVYEYDNEKKFWNEFHGKSEVLQSVIKRFSKKQI